MTDDQIEQELQAKGKTAARITPDAINALVESLQTRAHHFEGTTVTVAIAMLPSGFVAGIGKSAAVSPANFDAEIGAKIACANAVKDARERLWELEGYALKKALG